MDRKNTHCSWCSGINCSNSRNKRPDLTYFHFPRDPTRSKRWVIASRREDLLKKSTEKLHKNNCLCEVHFEPSCFKHSKVRKLLTKDAIPTIFDFTMPQSKEKDQQSSEMESPISSQIFHPHRVPREESSHKDRICSDQSLSKEFLNHVKDKSFQHQQNRKCQNADKFSDVANDDGKKLEEDSDSDDATDNHNKDDIDNNDSSSSNDYHPLERRETVKNTVELTDDMESTISSSRKKETMERSGKVLKIQRPFKDSDVMMLVKEYLQLYKMIQQLKQLARINVDLLYLSLGKRSNFETKEEVDKVQELIFTLMNGREVYDIEILNEETDLPTEDMEGLVKVKIMSDKTKEEDKECQTGQDSKFDECETKQEIITDDLPQGTGPAACPQDLENLQSLEHRLNPYVKKENLVGVAMTTVAQDDGANDMGDDYIDENVTVNFLLADGSTTLEGVDCETFKNRLELDQYLESHKDSGPHICKVCNKHFKGKHYLGKHLEKHLENKLYICKLCGKEFVTRRSWQHHEWSHGRQKSDIYYKCKECDREFLFRYALFKHMDLMHSSGHKSELCSICGVTFKCKKSLSQHLESHEEFDKNGPQKCTVCDKEFIAKRSLEEHMKQHEEFNLNGPQKCSACGKEFMTKKLLQLHMKRHVEFVKNGPQKCTICNKVLMAKKSLQVHMKRHLEFDSTGFHKCTICGKEFAAKRIFNEHMQRHEEFDKYGPQKCQVCGREFKLRQYLRNHMRCHLTNSNLMCDVCGKTFKCPIRLKNHKRIQHLLGPAPCTICGKKLNQNNMKRHMRLHSGDRPYKCSMCPKTFTQSTARNSHQITHTKIYPYRCSHCGRGFIAPGQLSFHKLSHTGERPFKCSLCDKSFASSSLLEAHTAEFGPSHVGAATNEKQYKCSLCKRQFKRSIPFALHILSSHIEELNYCLLCNNDDVTFTSPLDLESHLKNTHLNEMPYKCNKCGESFYTFYKCLNHKRKVHDGKSVFKCSDCEKSYTTSVGLFHHRNRKHSNEPLKFFRCQICGKQFDSKSNQLRHTANHSGLKPYKCSICGAAFSQKSSCQTHLWTHSREKRYPCHKCGKGFNDKRNFQSHLKKSHPEDGASQVSVHALSYVGENLTMSQALSPFTK